jgi:hypothetical protein
MSPDRRGRVPHTGTRDTDRFLASCHQTAVGGKHAQKMRAKAKKGRQTDIDKFDEVKEQLIGESLSGHLVDRSLHTLTVPGLALSDHALI